MIGKYPQARLLHEAIAHKPKVVRQVIEISKVDIAIGMAIRPATNRSKVVCQGLKTHLVDGTVKFQIAETRVEDILDQMDD